MSLDELKYVSILAGSIPLGICMKQTGKLAREVGASVIGFTIVAATCGFHTFHSMLCILVTWAIIRFCTRHCYNLTLAWMFSYLLFFRMLGYLHLPSPTPFANAVQLLLTLKMVSLAAELNPVYLEALSRAKPGPTDRHPLARVMPGLREILCYSYCYLGIMTGPFYRYRTYQDWVQHSQLPQVPSWKPLLHRLRLVPFYGAAFLLVSRLCPLEFVRTADFAQCGFLYCLLYTAAIFFVFRMRFYVAWTFAESACIAAGFGAYPVTAQSRPGNGPTNTTYKSSEWHEYDYETIRNIDPYNTDFCSSVKDGMKYWNMTVQWWLASYIYRHAPMKPRLLRVGWTMLVSAFWHGLHPGYYLSFLTIPVCLAAEGVMETGVRQRLGPRPRLAYDWLHWFWKMRAYDYMCAGFVLLTLPDTLAHWRRLYFYMHLLSLALFILGYLASPQGRRPRSGPDRRPPRPPSAPPLPFTPPPAPSQSHPPPSPTSRQPPPPSPSSRTKGSEQEEHSRGSGIRRRSSRGDRSPSPGPTRPRSRSRSKEK
ncbi:lysophospholipid acyltransferase 7 [Pristis pectinata]|uniref:lysophospholipid acyltransferase 7 n=1 Tax=Pristis pectinata TaxID=685728 RepID=UPI00223E5C26|nr:lysophospholipid acyltransferase 7 [Pristis pectinata]